MSSLAFQFNNKVYNFDVNSFGLYRQNAMTVYEGVMDGVILAREVPADEGSSPERGLRLLHGLAHGGDLHR